MKCVLCDEKSKIKVEKDTEDCIITFLDGIKYHYLSFKSKLNDSQEEIEKLKRSNIKLTETIEQLQNDLNVSSTQKRRKTNSIESLREPDKLAKGIQPDNSTDDLNEAITGDDNWDDIFLAPSTQELQDEKNTSAANKNTTEIDLQSSNSVEYKSIHEDPGTKNVYSPNETILPKRKAFAKGGVNNNENRNILNTNNWLSTRQRNRGLGALTNNQSISFLQPFKSPERGNKNNSPEKKSSPKSGKKSLSVLNRTGTKLRQTTIDFKKKPELNETFCEDLVAPSPTSNHFSSNEPGRLSKLLSLRKQPYNFINKSPISSKKKPNLPPSPDDSVGPSPGKGKIKREPIVPRTSVKVNLFNKLPLSPRKNEPSKVADDDSSVFIIPSQPDDVVIVEDSETDAVSADLLRDMMYQDDHLLQYLRDPRTARTLKPSDKKPPEEKKTGIRKKLENMDCSDCAAYFKYIGKRLSDEELEKRLQNCKHKDTVALHHTPEGFWDPDFRVYPPDDPRNITLIDTRFADEKNSG